MQDRVREGYGCIEGKKKKSCDTDKPKGQDGNPTLPIPRLGSITRIPRLQCRLPPPAPSGPTFQVVFPPFCSVQRVPGPHAFSHSARVVRAFLFVMPKSLPKSLYGHWARKQKLHSKEGKSQQACCAVDFPWISPFRPSQVGLCRPICYLTLPAQVFKYSHPTFFPPWLGHPGGVPASIHQLRTESFIPDLTNLIFFLLHPRLASSFYVTISIHSTSPSAFAHQ